MDGGVVDQSVGVFWISLWRCCVSSVGVVDQSVEVLWISLYVLWTNL